MHLSWLDPHKMRKMTVVGREKMVVFDDMELERKVTIYEKSPWKRAETYGEWQTRSGDISIPKISTAEPLRLECTYFLELVDRRARPWQGRARRRARRARTRDAHELAPCLRSTRRRSSTPARCSAKACACSRTPWSGSSRHSAASSTARREPLPPATIGDGTIVSTGAIVFAGATVGANCIVGDQSCIRERVQMADDCILGRGSLIENDTTVGQRHADPGGGVRDGVLDARGRRLHRAVRRHHERQLHGPHRAAQGAAQGPDDQARRAGRRRRRSSAPRSRSARRRSSAQERS